MRPISARLIQLCTAAAVVAMPLRAFAEPASQQAQQELVDRATLAAQEVLGGQQGAQARSVFTHARAVLICPRVFRASFLFGGEGGGCVLLARGGQGSWSAPAFYSMGGGSFGLQAGIQDAEFVMMIMTQQGLRATLDSQFRLGADASVALVTLGGGVEGATAPALNADIVAFARNRGLFAGISVQGSVMSSDSAGDQVYYGSPVGAIDIVEAMRVNNPGADPLRSALMRFSAPPTPLAGYAPAQAYAAAPPPGDYQQQPVYPPGAPSGVQQQELAPPR